MRINAKLETENTGTILVTGGTGMLGRFIVLELQRINHLEFFGIPNAPFSTRKSRFFKLEANHAVD